MTTATAMSEAFAMADRVVIMSRGEIAQVGSPRDIYREPANRFVAEFVGRNNIISGVVRATAGSELTVDSPLGTFTVHRNGNGDGTDLLSVGSSAIFVIAADLVTVSRTKPKAENVVECELVSEEFIGSVVTLFLEAADGTELKVQLQERELATLDAHSGGRFYLSWKADSAHILQSEG